MNSAKIFCTITNIVTNSLPIAVELLDAPQHRVVLLGGIVNPQHAFVYGDDAMTLLRRYKADIAFLCVDGISAEHGITIYQSEEAERNRLMIERAYSTVVVADYNKVGRESFTNISCIDTVDTLITNLVANKDDVAAMIQAGVDVIQV